MWRERSCLAWVVIFLICGLGYITFLPFGVDFFTNSIDEIFTFTAMPGWVQAFGSILAILVAIVISQNQTDRAERLQTQIDVLQATNGAIALRSIGMHATNRYNSVRENIESVGSGWTALVDKKMCDEFTKVSQMAGEIQLGQLPTQRFVFLAIELRTVLQVGVDTLTHVRDRNVTVSFGLDFLLTELEEVIKELRWINTELTKELRDFPREPGLRVFESLTALPR